MELFEKMFGPELAQRLIDSMLERSEEFREDHENYMAAMDKLGKSCPEEANAVHRAVLRQCASDLIFAGVRGCKMNADHFMNPLTPNCTWPQVDYNDYLRENIAHSLPEYQAAERELENSHRKIPEDIWNAVGTYRRHLETVGPKLAHYCGYIAGNKLLYRLIPGYCPDPVLTLRYTVMLEETAGEYLKN